MLGIASYMEGMSCLGAAVGGLENGNSVRIWQHHWLPRKHPPLVLSPMVDTLADAKVAILIEENSRQWNHELIDGILTPLEAELIEAIPLS